MAIVLWNKKYTETLAETLKRFRIEKKEFRNEKVTYAGRLDPMAEGLLILLTGEDVYKKKDFLGLDKVYEIDFIFGPDTDTYDILGFLGKKSIGFTSVDINKLKSIFKKNIGKYNQEYPPYSSKTVDKKPLFIWAREGGLSGIIIPSKDIEIYSVKYLYNKEINSSKLESLFLNSIQNVVGDFRQDSISDAWRKYFNIYDNRLITVYSIRVHASSGSYMRSFVKRFGRDLNIPSCTIKIKRIQIGTYKL